MMMTKMKWVLILMLLPSMVAGQSLIPAPRRMEKISDRIFRFENVEEKIRVTLDSTLKLPTDEAYVLEIGRGKIGIRAKNNIGVIWARQTLRQLERVTERGTQLPNVRIVDWPEFPVRGFMLDCGRNFMELPMLKEYLDILSDYKVNMFHWHLTDHPGWRIECRAYPQLNDPKTGIAGRDEGRFYTYDEIREVIRYARERGITVIPEIDMPGHSAFFEKAFGFRMETPEGMQVLASCLEEFFSEIPASDCPWFHIGSDEVHIPNPGPFMHFMEELVTRSGRRVIAWDPGLPGDPATIRQIWQDSGVTPGGKISTTHNFLDSYMGYLNYFDPMVFTYRMILHNTGIRSPHHLGGILCLWNDVRVVDKSRIAPHNGFLNGLLPFAERFWTGTIAPFEGDPNLLPSPESEAGAFIREFEQRMMDHKTRLLSDQPFYWFPSSTMEWQLSAPMPLNTDTAGMARHPAWGGSIDLESWSRKFGVKPAAGQVVYARTRWFAKSDTTIHAWIGFETPARSNRISGGIGKAGEWENQGELRINGIDVPPPRWNEPGAYAFHFNTWGRPEELLPYTDEQFYWMRPPVPIRLKKGWNSVEVKAVRRFVGQRWSFAAILL
ncbi:MAG: family 20 glycosylhydrolase [Bacteroidales bacterium]|nr:family 20 glycosylhydrolase [Bacteroidales bacterium]